MLQSWEISGFSPVWALPRFVELPLGYLHHLRHDKMSDKETLLSMGFDPARVDCEYFLYRTRVHPAFVLIFSGVFRV